MSDWQVGDRAICVTDNITGFGFTKKVKVGRISTVEAMYLGRGGKYDGVLALVLTGVLGRQYPGMHHGLFRKLEDHVPDEFDHEIIRMINSLPVGCV